MVLGNEARCVSEDEIVDVRVLEGRVGVLPEAVDKKEDAQGKGEGVEGCSLCEEGTGE